MCHRAATDYIQNNSSRLGMNMVQGLVFFGWFGRLEVQFWRTNLSSGGSKFSGSLQYPMENLPIYGYSMQSVRNLWFSSSFGHFLPDPPGGPEPSGSGFCALRNVFQQKSNNSISFEDPN